MPRAGYLLQSCVDHFSIPRPPSVPTQPQVLSNLSENPSSALSVAPHPPPPPQSQEAASALHLPGLGKGFSAHELPVTAVNYYCQAWPQLSESNSLSLEFF